MANPNPITLSVQPNTGASIDAVSNAAFFQRVTLTWEGGSATFQGSGEAQPMMLPNGQPLLSLPPTAAGYSIAATFEYSEKGASGPFYLATIQNPTVSNVPSSMVPYNITRVGTEDGSDKDNNDTMLTIVAIGFPSSNPISMSTIAPPPTPPPEAGAHAAAASKFETRAPKQPAAPKQLELHAKTYYNDPAVKAGDEHLFGATVTGEIGFLECRSMGWDAWGIYVNDTRSSTFGGYLYVTVLLKNCKYDGMAGLYLQLDTVFSYWTSPPTGYKTAGWKWQVTDTTGDALYTVTRVTD